MPTLEFFYDYASPWSYMAFCQVEDLAREAGAELVWRPVQMAEVFARANHGVADMRSRPVPARLPRVRCPTAMRSIRSAST